MAGGDEARPSRPAARRTSPAASPRSRTRQPAARSRASRALERRAASCRDQRPALRIPASVLVTDASASARTRRSKTSRRAAVARRRQRRATAREGSALARDARRARQRACATRSPAARCSSSTATSTPRCALNADGVHLPENGAIDRATRAQRLGDDMLDLARRPQHRGRARRPSAKAPTWCSSARCSRRHRSRAGARSAWTALRDVCARRPPARDRDRRHHARTRAT